MATNETSRKPLPHREETTQHIVGDEHVSVDWMSDDNNFVRGLPDGPYWMNRDKLAAMGVFRTIPEALRKIIAEHAADAATASGAPLTAGVGIGTRRVLADLCALIGEPEPWAA